MKDKKHFAWGKGDITIEEETKKSEFTVYKADEDKHLVFGWASVSITIDGEPLEDRQHDMIEPGDLEDAAYEYVLNFRDTGEEHLPGYRKKGKLVESVVFTPEKQKAMGIPAGTLPVAWWVGFKIEDEDTWRRVKNGTYRMFSIEGRASREPVPVDDPEPVAKTFDDVLKFNPYHDKANGRFTGPNAMGAFSPLFGATEHGQKLLDHYKQTHGKETTGDKDVDDALAALGLKPSDLDKIKAMLGPNWGNSSSSDSTQAAKPEQQKPAEKPASFGNTEQQTGHKTEDYTEEHGGTIYLSDKGIEDLAADLGVSYDDSKRMGKSVLAYSKFDYDSIRAAGRGENVADKYKQEAADIEEFIQLSPKWAGGELHRGIKVFEQSKLDEMLSAVAQGKPIDLRGASSWSSDPGVADNFSGGKFPVILHTNGGSTSHGTSIKHLSAFKSEDEVLMSKDAIYTPTRMEKIGGTVHIYGDMP